MDSQVAPAPAPSSIQRNAAINLIGAVAPIVVGLVTVPLYLRLIGDTRYGALSVVWAFVGYFGVFDLGVGVAVTNRIASLHNAPGGEVRTVLWTAVALNVAFGVFGAAILLPFGSALLGGVFEMPADLRAEALGALPWLALAVPISTVSSVLSGSLVGRERFLAANVIAVAGTVLLQAVPLVVAATLGPALAGLIAATVLVRLATTVSSLAVCLTDTRLSGLPRVSAKVVGPLLRYGGWVGVSGAIGPLLTILDRLVIGARAGVQAVTYYTLPSNLVTQLAIVPSALSRALFPRFSALRGDEALAVAGRATSVLAAVVTPLAVLGILLLRPFMRIWIGEPGAELAGPVGEILVVGVWVNGLAMVPYTLLQGQGRPDLTAKFHLLELPPYLVALWLGLVVAGIQGAAIAWVLRVWVDAALLFRASGMPNRDLRLLAPGAALVALTSCGALTLFADPIWRVGAGGGLLVASCVWAWWTAPELRGQLARVLRRSSALLG